MRCGRERGGALGPGERRSAETRLTRAGETEHTADERGKRTIPSRRRDSKSRRADVPKQSILIDHLRQMLDTQRSGNLVTRAGRENARNGTNQNAAVATAQEDAATRKKRKEPSAPSAAPASGQSFLVVDGPGKAAKHQRRAAPAGSTSKPVPTAARQETTCRVLKKAATAPSAMGKAAQPNSARANASKPPSAQKQPMAQKKPSAQNPPSAQRPEPSALDHSSQSKATGRLSEASGLRAALESSQEDNNALTEQIETLQAARFQAQQAQQALQTKLTTETAAREAEAKARGEAEAEIAQLRAALVAAETATAAADASVAQLSDAKASLEASLAAREADVAHLAERARGQEELRRQMHETISELKGSIRVFCRVRPALVGGVQQARGGGEPSSLARVPPASANSAAGMEPTLLDLFAPPKDSDAAGTPAGGKGGADKPIRFKFDHVFGERASQADIFREVSQLTQSAIDGYKVCIFAYGQTGSGKTFTMSGAGDGDGRGVIPRAAQQVFSHCAELRLLGWSFEFRASALEIYNEELRDLLPADSEAADAPSSRRSGVGGGKDAKLRVVDVKGDVSVPGLRSARIHNADELGALLTTAAKERSTAATKCNAASSRSHYIFRMGILGKNAKTGASSEGELNLVDLAGSERVKESGVAGAALKEAQCINTSLSALGKVIASMSEKKASSKTVVPFRDSALTHLLKPSLSGSAKMLMFVNISPQERHYQETKSSLQFAAKANAVEVGPAKKAAAGPA